VTKHDRLIILEFLQWLDSESISLAGNGYAGELIECGKTHSELVAEFMSQKILGKWSLDIKIRLVPSDDGSYVLEHLAPDGAT
jgi:hypothetical protein